MYDPSLLNVWRQEEFDSFEMPPNSGENDEEHVPSDNQIQGSSEYEDDQIVQDFRINRVQEQINSLTSNN